MSKFYPLTVTDIQPATKDAVILTLEPQNPDDFSFVSGQYLTLRRHFDGVELRRCYSICAGEDEGILQVGIKAVDGGVFSSFANSTLAIGDKIDAMPPMGNFHAKLNGSVAKSYLGFAGGSGITPLLSIIKTVLRREPKSNFTLVYGNRSVASIIFRQELDDLKDTYLNRLNIIHILESGTSEIDLFSGRVDADKCAALLENWIPVDRFDSAFICGPEPMMIAVRDTLYAAGMSKETVKIELFLSSQPGRAKTKAKSRHATQSGKACTATITIDGIASIVEIPDGKSVLQAALDADMDAPFACRAGVCSSCKAKLTKGKVEMDANHALEDYEVEAGYILTCQSHPLTDEIAVEYDQ